MASADTVSGHVEMLPNGAADMNPRSDSGAVSGRVNAARTDTVGGQAQYANVSNTLSAKFDLKEPVRGRVGGPVAMFRGPAYNFVEGEPDGSLRVPSRSRTEFTYDVMAPDPDQQSGDDIRDQRQGMTVEEMLRAGEECHIRWPHPEAKVRHEEQICLYLDFECPAHTMSELLQNQQRSGFAGIRIPVNATALNAKLSGMRLLCQRHGYDLVPHVMTITRKHNRGMPCPVYWQLYSVSNHDRTVHWMDANRVHCGGQRRLGVEVRESDLACCCDPHESSSQCNEVKYVGDEVAMDSVHFKRWAVLDEDSIMKHLNSNFNIPARPQLYKFVIDNPETTTAPDPITYLVVKNFPHLLKRAQSTAKLNFDIDDALERNEEGGVNIYMPKVLVNELVTYALRQVEYRNRCMRMSSMYMSMHCGWSWEELRARHQGRMSSMPRGLADEELYCAGTLCVRGVVLRGEP